MPMLQKLGGGCFMTSHYQHQKYSCHINSSQWLFAYRITGALKFGVQFVSDRLVTPLQISNPWTDLDRRWGFREVEASRFQDNRHMKVVRLSALHTGHLYHSGNIPGTHFCRRLSRPQGHSATGRIMSIKNSNDTIGNRTRDLTGL